MNSVSGNVSFTDPLISVYGKTTNNIIAQIELQHLIIKGFSYWDYFFNNRISLENILFNQPKIIYYHNYLVKPKSYQNTYKNPIKKAVQIEIVEMEGGYIEVYNAATDSLISQSKNVSFKMNSVVMDQSTVKHKIPITYKGFSASSNNLFYRLNTYENLFLEHIDFNTSFSKIRGVKIKTKYSKEDLSKQISVERDYFDLTIDSIAVKNQDLGFKQDSLFYFKSDRVDFYQPTFKIYRDKLVADDLSFKPLYSKMLRDLNFTLTLDNVFINNSSITYTEKVKTATLGGSLLFSKLTAEIKNLSNAYNANKTITSANIDAIFMDTTPLHAEWKFEVKNPNDEFIFKAELGKLKAKNMNQFMEPNLNVRLEGEITKTYFTINGNDHTSQIDLKLKYDDFEVAVLKENGKEKNKLLSSLVNLFVSKNSTDKAGEFRHGSKSDVERTTNKSVFNYLWINIKVGLMNAMTGNGIKNKKD